MIKTLKLLATLRDVAGTSQLDVPFEDGQTVRELLQTINDMCPSLGAKIIAGDELTGLVQILVHGRNISWLQGLDTTIQHDDVITLLPPSAGG
jgi:molybdopterin synthase sulfur carrier subunit